MTRTLIRDVRLVDPEAGTEAPGALVIEGGHIAGLFPAAPEGDFATIVDGRGCCLAPGIVDWGVKVGEPGERHKESLRSAGLAAAAGGVTTLVTRPDTEPALDSPEALEFVRRRAASECPVRVLPMAALTRGREGREMAEMGFLRDAGAVAFTDADRVVMDSRVLARAMTYARGLGALVATQTQDPWLSQGAAATSGKLATLKGLPGVSPIAERIGLERDLALAEMTGVAFHAHQVTTAAALPALAEREKLDHITLSPLYGTDTAVRWALAPLGVAVERNERLAGTLRIINFPLLMEQMAPYFRERLGEDFERLIYYEQEGKFVFGFGRQRFEIPDRTALALFLFGPQQSKDAVEPPAGPLGEVLQAVFPMPYVYPGNDNV